MAALGARDVLLRFALSFLKPASRVLSNLERENDVGFSCANSMTIWSRADFLICTCNAFPCRSIRPAQKFLFPSCSLNCLADVENQHFHLCDMDFFLEAGAGGAACFVGPFVGERGISV